MSTDLPVRRKLGVVPTLFAAARRPQFVIPGRIEDANSDVQLHIGESIATIGSMDSG